MSDRLYEMTGRLLALAELLDDPFVPDDAVRDTIEAVEGEIEIKAEGILKFVANLDGDIKAIEYELQRLQGRKRVLENRQARLRDYLRHNMEVTGISRIECSLFLITLAKGRAVVLVENEDQVPEEYVVTTISKRLDKARILRDLKAGQDIPGVTLGTSSPSLRIK